MVSPSPCPQNPHWTRNSGTTVDPLVTLPWPRDIDIHRRRVLTQPTTSISSVLNREESSRGPSLVIKNMSCKCQ